MTSLSQPLSSLKPIKSRRVCLLLARIATRCFRQLKPQLVRSVIKKMKKPKPKVIVEMTIRYDANSFGSLDKVTNWEKRILAHAEVLNRKVRVEEEQVSANILLAKRELNDIYRKYPFLVP